jgi:hypothetical protein
LCGRAHQPISNGNPLRLFRWYLNQNRIRARFIGLSKRCIEFVRTRSSRFREFHVKVNLFVRNIRERSDRQDRQLLSLMQQLLHSADKFCPTGAQSR